MDIESGEFMEKAELVYVGRSESRVERHTAVAIMSCGLINN